MPLILMPWSTECPFGTLDTFKRNSSGYIYKTWTNTSEIILKWILVVYLELAVNVVQVRYSIIYAMSASVTMNRIEIFISEQHKGRSEFVGVKREVEQRGHIIAQQAWTLERNQSTYRIAYNLYMIGRTVANSSRHWKRCSNWPQIQETDFTNSFYRKFL